MAFFRTLLFTPQVLSGIAVGIIWKWMYDPTDGPINRALISIGVPASRSRGLATSRSRFRRSASSERG